MKIIHTADWHIGQYFFGYDRHSEHTYFLDWLKQTIAQQQIDALLIAGDIFDSPNPSAQSQKVYYQFLREVSYHNPHLQIIITAGNHDSAARLEATNPLLQEMNISVRGVVKRDADNQIDPQHLIIPLSHKGQTYAWCMAVPYLRQGDYPPAQTHAEGIKSMYDLLHQHVEKLNVNKLPIIAMGHLQATGSELSENDRSERSIIGGLECVSPEAFDKQGIVYTALGHLHKPQRVSGREHVRYAGSPLPMSFSEKNYKQGVNLIYVDNNKLESIERIDFTPPIRLISLPKQPKPLQEVLDEIALLPDGEIDAQSPYLELKVLITQPEPSMRNQLEEALRNKAVRLTSAVPYRLKTNRETNTIGYEELKTINPMSLAENFYQSKYATPMPNSIKTLLQAVIQEAQL